MFCFRGLALYLQVVLGWWSTGSGFPTNCVVRGFHPCDRPWADVHEGSGQEFSIRRPLANTLAKATRSNPAMMLALITYPKKAR